MYIHHQPEHWNTDRWSEHWSSCYSQMFCWKLLSPGVHVECHPPKHGCRSGSPLMAAALPDCRTTHLQHCRNSSGVAGVELAFEFLRSQISWASVGCTRTKSHPRWSLHGSVSAHGTSCGSSVGLRSGEFRFQVDTLSSLSRSAGRSWPATEECLCHEEVHSVCSCVWVTGVSPTGVYVKTRTQGFPAECGIVTRWSMLFISPVTGFKLVADTCMCTRYKQINTNPPQTH